MSVTKTPVRVGGNNATDPSSGLPMYRKYLTFEGNREAEFIEVQYEQYLESNGKKLDVYQKSYIVKDIPEVGHTVWGDPTLDPPTEDVYVVDTPMIPMFSEGWMKRKIKATANGLEINGQVVAPIDYELNFGEDLIVGVINQTLASLPFDAVNGYITHP